MQDTVQWGYGSWPDGLPKKGGANALSGAGSLDTATTCLSKTSRTKNFIIEFQDTGPPSAYPGRYPRPWLLRLSLSPAASGWHLLSRATSSREDHWGLRRSLSPWLEPVGRHSPPGFVTVPPGQRFDCQRRILCPFGSSVSASYAGLQSRWLNHVFAFAAHRFLLSERSRGGS
jgi:hypothetical protein